MGHCAIPARVGTDLRVGQVNDRFRVARSKVTVRLRELRVGTRLARRARLGAPHETAARQVSRGFRKARGQIVAGMRRNCLPGQ